MYQNSNYRNVHIKNVLETQTPSLSETSTKEGQQLRRKRLWNICNGGFSWCFIPKITTPKKLAEIISRIIWVISVWISGKESDGPYHCYSRTKNSRKNKSINLPLLLKDELFPPKHSCKIQITNLNIQIPFHDLFQHQYSHTERKFQISRNRRTEEDIAPSCKIPPFHI